MNPVYVFFPAETLDGKLTTLELVNQLSHPSSGIRIPVIAAGGIMTGQDIFEALQAGAVGVQMGTAFLPCTESTASAAHKRYLLQHTHRGCVYTNAFSGRPAQGIRNEFINSMEKCASILDFPLQNTLTSAIRVEAVRADDGERQSLWAGSNYGKAADRKVVIINTICAPNTENSKCRTVGDDSAPNDKCKNINGTKEASVRGVVGTEASCVVDKNVSSGSAVHEVRYLSAGELLQQLRDEYHEAAQKAAD